MLIALTMRKISTILKELAFGYLLLINTASFILMGVDKASAIRNESRMPEKWFFTISTAGGPLGVFLGMIIFHHKTRKAYFRIHSHAGASNTSFHPHYSDKTIRL